MDTNFKKELCSILKIFLSFASAPPPKLRKLFQKPRHGCLHLGSDVQWFHPLRGKERVSKALCVPTGHLSPSDTHGKPAVPPFTVDALPKDLSLRFVKAKKALPRVQVTAWIMLSSPNIQIVWWRLRHHLAASWVWSGEEQKGKKLSNKLKYDRFCWSLLRWDLKSNTVAKSSVKGNLLSCPRDGP